MGEKVSVKVTITADGYATSTLWANGRSTVAHPPAWFDADGAVAEPLAGIYYAQATGPCYWETYADNGETVELSGWDDGTGQRMVSFGEPVRFIWAGGCGPWYRYDGTATVRTWIPGDSVSIPGVHFSPGTYRSDGGEGCWFGARTRPSGIDGDLLWSGESTGAVTVTLSNGASSTNCAPLFESFQCGNWKRIG